MKRVIGWFLKPISPATKDLSRFRWGLTTLLVTIIFGVFVHGITNSQEKAGIAMFLVIMFFFSLLVPEKQKEKDD